MSIRRAGVTSPKIVDALVIEAVTEIRGVAALRLMSASRRADSRPRRATPIVGSSACRSVKFQRSPSK